MEWARERACMGEEAGAKGEEAGSSRSREPNVGLTPRTPRSWPELKVDAQPLSHRGIPRNRFFFLYSWERERERQRHRRREKQASCREPDVGLNPGTPGLRPGPKAGAKPLSHTGIPRLQLLNCPKMDSSSHMQVKILFLEFSFHGTKI